MAQLAELQRLWDRIKDLPNKYSLEYNDPKAEAECRKKFKGETSGKSGKNAMLIQEVTVKCLKAVNGLSSSTSSSEGGESEVKVKLSSSDKNLGKLRRAASSVLQCSEEQVILVRQGRVLPASAESGADSEASKLIDLIIHHADIPIYCFDRRKIDRSGIHLTSSLELTDTFSHELVALLMKHGSDCDTAKTLASSFMLKYKEWLK